MRMTFLTVAINSHALLNFVWQLNNKKLITFKMNQTKIKYSENKRDTATNLASDNSRRQRGMPRGAVEHATYEDYGSIKSLQEIGLLMILFISIVMLGILFSIAEGFVYDNSNDASASISHSTSNDHVRFSMNDK